jgi:5-methylthioadenosine/S-adenosylhomocysteine deaminase
MEKELGTIEVGKKADLTLLNFNKTHLTPYRHPLSHLVYSAQGSDVDTVICNGQILMQNRQLLTLNEQQVIQQAEEAAKDLLT